MSSDRGALGPLLAAGPVLLVREGQEPRGEFAGLKVLRGGSQHDAEQLGGEPSNPRRGIHSVHASTIDTENPWPSNSRLLQPHNDRRYEFIRQSRQKLSASEMRLT